MSILVDKASCVECGFRFYAVVSNLCGLENYEKPVKDIYNSQSTYRQLNVWQLLSGGFRTSNRSDWIKDDKYGGAGAASFIGPCTWWAEDESKNRMYDSRPVFGCGGCGASHWNAVGEQHGRKGGNAAFLIFC